MTRRGWLLFLAVGVIWGMPYMLIRIAVATIDPLVIAFGRTLIGALLLLPIAMHRKALAPATIGVVTASLIVATVLYAPFVPFTWPDHPAAAGIAAVAGLGVLCTAVAFMFFFALIAEIGPARATVIAYVNPVVAMMLGVAFLHEPFTVGMAIGFTMVIVGSILATTKRTTNA